MNAIELQVLADADRTLAEDLCPLLRSAFRVPVRVREDAMPIDEFFDEERQQYNSTAILHRLHHLAVSSAPSAPAREDKVSILAVTRRDLFMPILTHVFGEAALGGSVAVVSYHRFQNELYGLPPDDRLLRERLRKVATHELAHTLGLVHCLLQECVMHASSYVEELDLKGTAFCSECQSVVDHAVRGHHGA